MIYSVKWFQMWSNRVDHNLEYGNTKSGQLEDWLVEKNNFYMHAIKKV